MSSSSALRIGVVGTGRMAATMTAAMAPMASVRAVAVASGSLERARAFASRFGLARSHEGVGALVRDADIELVYIANDTRLHADTAIAALEAGKSVLCEKPFSLDYAQGERVADAAKRSGRFFMEAVWTPLLPAYRRAIELARSHALGAPLGVTAEFGYPTTRAHHPGLWHKDGGGVVLDRAVYPIVLAMQVLGDVEDVAGSLVVDADGIDVHAAFSLAHAGGRRSHLVASLVGLASNTATVTCTGGSITLEEPLVGCERVTVRHARPPTGARPQTPRSAPSAKERVIASLRQAPALRRLKHQLTAPRSEVHAFGHDAYAPLLEHVAALVRAGQRESPIVPLAQSLAIVKVLDRLRAQASRGPLSVERPR